MGDRIPFSVPGAVASWLNTDHAVGVLGIAGEVIRTFGVVTDAPSGGDCVFDLRDATGGGGSGVTVTIADGTTYASDTSSLDVTSSETLYIRPTAANGALNLSGWFEFDAVGTASVSSFLTTLSRVKTDHGLSTASYDAQISRLIQGISEAMQNRMRRRIVDTTYTDEVHSGNGWQKELILKHRPITSTTSLVVKRDDVAQSASLYTQEDEEGILYLVDGYWTSGTRNYTVTYSAGYAQVPEDIALACTAQVRHEFAQSQPSGTNRLGLKQSADAGGSVTTYDDYDWLPFVLNVIDRWMRR